MKINLQISKQLIDIQYILQHTKMATLDIAKNQSIVRELKTLKVTGVFKGSYAKDEPLISNSPQKLIKYIVTRIKCMTSRGLLCLRPFLLQNHLPSKLLIIVDDLVIHKRDEIHSIHSRLKPLFSRRLKRKSHDLLLKVFSKSIQQKTLGDLLLLLKAMILDAIIELLKIIWSLTNVD